MVSFCDDATFVNSIVNHPSVFPWICGPLTDAADLSELMGSGRYTALMGEHGGFLFLNLGNGIYDAHSAVVPEGRGAWAVLAAQHALRIMFEERDAREIMMACPKGNLAVRALVKSLHAEYRGRIENGWWLNGRAVPSDIYSMTKTNWERTCQSYCQPQS